MLFLTDSYKYSFDSKITNTGEDDKGTFVVLEETAFYPQGGGQPADIGELQITNGQKLVVTFVRNVDDEIRHYYVSDDSVCELKGGTTVHGKIDVDRRMSNASHHTLAHLISHVVEAMHPSLKAVKGHSFPNEAYVEFTGEENVAQDAVVDGVNTEISKGIEITMFDILRGDFEERFYKLPYPIPEDKPFRAVQIGSFLPIPCGGTHLKNVNEIRDFSIRKITSKKGKTKVFYACAA